MEEDCSEAAGLSGISIVVLLLSTNFNYNNKLT